MTTSRRALRSPAAVARAAQAARADFCAMHRRRLDRLEAQIEADPADGRLRIDAFEAALAAGEWQRAGRQVDAALGAPDAGLLAWRLRAGELLLAQGRDFEATEVFDALAATHPAPRALHDALLPHLAQLDLRQERAADAVERLASTLEGLGAGMAQGPEADVLPTAWEALCRLWLRALQRDRQSARALAWARRADAADRLDASAAGVASLVAFDEGEVLLAQQWSDRSFEASSRTDEPGPPEAAVTLAAIALAAQDAASAVEFADIALHRQLEDGRAWSVRGSAHLMVDELDAAAEALSWSLATLPGHVDTWLGLGWTRLRQAEASAARILFETALTLDDQRADSHGALAVVLALQHEHADAAAHVESALRLDDSDAASRIAQALLRGEVHEADVLSRLPPGQQAGSTRTRPEFGGASVFSQLLPIAVFPPAAP